MRAAVITDGIVTNVIVLENPEDAQAFGAEVCEEFVNIGWSYDGVTYHPPTRSQGGTR